MANNTTLNSGSGGDIVRDIDRAGVKTQVVLLDVGGTSGEALAGDSNAALPVKTLPLASVSLSSVAASVSNVTLLTSNANRRLCIVSNDSTATLYLKYGITASTSSYSVKMPPSTYWEMPAPIYTGQIDGIWDNTGGSIRITEGN